MAKVVEKGIFGWLYLNTASSFVLKVINYIKKLFFLIKYFILFYYRKITYKL
jgi:hypothetical protein